MPVEPFSERFFQALEQNSQLFSSLSDEVKFQLKTVIEGQIENFNLVTREEFDALRISLDRALARIEKLEAENESNQHAGS